MAGALNQAVLWYPCAKGVCQHRLIHRDLLTLPENSSAQPAECKQTQPQAVLVAWALPTLLPNKCLFFIWKHKHLTSPLFNKSWGFMANQQRKKNKPQNSFQVQTSQCKRKAHRRADALKCWYSTMIQCHALFFFPFFPLESSGTWIELTCILAQEWLVLLCIHIKHLVLKQTRSSSYQYLQASKLIELKAQSMPLTTSSAGSCLILASGQKKHQYKRNSH